MQYSCDHAGFLFSWLCCF